MEQQHVHNRSAFAKQKNRANTKLDATGPHFQKSSHWLKIVMQQRVWFLADRAPARKKIASCLIRFMSGITLTKNCQPVAVCRRPPDLQSVDHAGWWTWVTVQLMVQLSSACRHLSVCPSVC